MRISYSATLAIAMILTACGKPDASGIYVFKTDREVMLIQLVQSANGELTGRFQSNLLNDKGVVVQKSGNADGLVSGRDLVLKPSSAWYGGVQASGSFTGSSLTLSGEGFNFSAASSSLEQYQKALTDLESAAADDRQKLMNERAAARQQQAQAQHEQDAEAKAKLAFDAGAGLRDDAANLSAAIARAPDYGQMAATGTAKVARMLKVANSLSGVARGQLGVAANQVEVETNQIEVARSQYSLGLNQILEDARTRANVITRICAMGSPTQVVVACEEAKAAIGEFKQAEDRSRSNLRTIQSSG